jgi:hypothetical protein
LSLHLKWRGDETALKAADEFAKVSDQAKALILKGARAVNSKKPLDAAPFFSEMSGAYERGMTLLVSSSTRSRA